MIVFVFSRTLLSTQFIIVNVTLKNIRINMKLDTVGFQYFYHLNLGNILYLHFLKTFCKEKRGHMYVLGWLHIRFSHCFLQVINISLLSLAIALRLPCQ